MITLKIFNTDRATKTKIGSWNFKLRSVSPANFLISSLPKKLKHSPSCGFATSCTSGSYMEYNLKNKDLVLNKHYLSKKALIVEEHK